MITRIFTILFFLLLLLLHLFATTRKRPVSLPKTTRRFMESDLSFYGKRAVVLLYVEENVYLPLPFREGNEEGQ